jgi:hypothetical protein
MEMNPVMEIRYDKKVFGLYIVRDDKYNPFLHTGVALSQKNENGKLEKLWRSDYGPSMIQPEISEVNQLPPGSILILEFVASLNYLLHIQALIKPQMGTYIASGDKVNNCRTHVKKVFAQFHNIDQQKISEILVAISQENTDWWSTMLGLGATFVSVVVGASAAPALILGVGVYCVGQSIGHNSQKNY